MVPGNTRIIPEKSTEPLYLSRTTIVKGGWRVRDIYLSKKRGGTQLNILIKFIKMQRDREYQGCHMNRRKGW